MMHLRVGPGPCCVKKKSVSASLPSPYPFVTVGASVNALLLGSSGCVTSDVTCVILSFPPGSWLNLMVRKSLAWCVSIEGSDQCMVSLPPPMVKLDVPLPSTVDLFGNGEKTI